MLRPIPLLYPTSDCAKVPLLEILQRVYVHVLEVSVILRIHKSWHETERRHCEVDCKVISGLDCNICPLHHHAAR